MKCDHRWREIEPEATDKHKWARRVQCETCKVKGRQLTSWRVVIDVAIVACLALVGLACSVRPLELDAPDACEPTEPDIVDMRAQRWFAPGESARIEAKCPEAYHVVDGGCEFGSPEATGEPGTITSAFAPVMSVHSFQRDGWTCAGTNGPDQLKVEAWVTCESGGGMRKE